MKKSMFFLALFLVGNLPLFDAQAQSHSVRPIQKTGSQDVKLVTTNSLPAGAAGIELTPYCYSTNNRGTVNPLNPESRIFVWVHAPEGKGLLLDFLHTSGTSTGSGTSTQISLTASDCGLTLLSDGNKLMVDTDSIKISEKILNGDYLVTAFGIENLTKNNGRLPVNCGEPPILFGGMGEMKGTYQYVVIQAFTKPTNQVSFYGYNGLMATGTKVEVKTNDPTKNDAAKPEGSTPTQSAFMNITLYMPGQDGFCGGYHSPLMLFFTENYPAFTGKSNFLLGEKTSTYWVESNHPGYFLVKLKNAKQAILPTDLFGDNKASSNGFEELKKLDSNGDNVIDEKDKEFKNLYLWSDANGNSKNDAKEVSSLKSKKVTSIDLKYNNDYRQDRMRAIMQGRTTFSYTNEKGVKATGEAFDIFFLGIKKK